jgi:hypothetical protein
VGVVFLRGAFPYRFSPLFVIDEGFLETGRQLNAGFKECLRLGSSTQVRAQVNALKQVFSELAIGLALDVVVILLLLTANFQSFRLSLIVISSVPAVLIGAILMLLVTETTLNLESFMGTIMAIGVAVANAILLVTFAEQNRRNGADAVSAARSAAAERLRPVLMTSRNDRWDVSHGTGDWSRQRRNSAAGTRSDWRLVCRHTHYLVRVADRLWHRSKTGIPRVAIP